MAGGGSGNMFATASQEHGNSTVTLSRSNSTSSVARSSETPSLVASVARRLLNDSGGTSSGTNSGNSSLTVDSKTKQRKRKAAADLEFDDWNSEVGGKSKFVPGSGKHWR